MGFADSYLEKHRLYNFNTLQAPSNSLGLVVVIPCYDEPDIINTCIRSLYQCQPPECTVEIIVVINSAENSRLSVVQQNKKTLSELTAFTNRNSPDKFRLIPLHVYNIPKKTAGAGYARKIGMDLAVQRFNEIDNSDGIIVSFDADSTCEDTYLVEIEKKFQSQKKQN